MEKDNLKDYIQKHRSDFDDRELPADLWSKVEQELDSGKSRVINIRKWISVAAMGIILLSVGVLMGIQLSGDTELRHGKELNEFAQAENFYSNEYRVKWSELQTAGVETDNIQEDLAQLDEVYLELKNELMGNPDLNTPKVVDALIENYRTKIDILETVQVPNYK